MSLSSVLRAGLPNLDLTDALLKDNNQGSIDTVTNKLKEKSGRIVEVTVKPIRTPGKNDQLLSDIRKWSELAQESIAQFKGYAFNGENLSIISEWVEGVMIMEYFKKEDKSSNEKFLLDTVTGIAEGLAYLHKNDVIHANLKASNVIMRNSGHPVLTDYGVSRSPNGRLATSESEAVALDYLEVTVPWLAYELLGVAEGGEENVPVECTKASDVWDFGMVIYELIAGAQPYSEVTGGPDELIPWRIRLTVRNKKLPSKTVNVNSPLKERLWNICEGCWESDPKERSTIDKVIKELSN